MTDRTKAQDAVDAIRAQYNELEGNKDSMQALPDYGAEVLRRWDDRTARVIRAKVSAIEAQKFLDVHFALRGGDLKGNLGRKVRAKKVFLTALVEELRQHPEALFERQLRTFPRVESGGISAEQAKQRLALALALIKEKTLADAERHGQLVSRIVGSVLVLVVLSGAVAFARQLMSHWWWIEPMAWAIAIALSVGSWFKLPVPKLSQVIQKAARRRRLNRIRRLIDFDAIEAILDGRDVDEAAHREPAAEGSPKAGDVEGGSVG